MSCTAVRSCHILHGSLFSDEERTVGTWESLILTHSSIIDVQNPQESMQGKGNFLEIGPQHFFYCLWLFCWTVCKFQRKNAEIGQIIIYIPCFFFLFFFSLPPQFVCTRNNVILNDDFLWVKHLWHIWWFGLYLHWWSNWGPCLI